MQASETALFFLDDPTELPALKYAASELGENRPSPWLVARRGLKPTFIASVAELMERSARLSAHYERLREDAEAL